MAEQRVRTSPIRYLYATLAQGSADAFVQATIPTGLSSLADFAYRVREILVEIPPHSLVAANLVEVALCHTSQAAMPDISNRALIYKMRYNEGMVTSGAVHRPEMIKRAQYAEDDNVLLITEDVFAQFDTASTGGTLTARMRIGYEVVRINELDRLTLLNQISLGL